MEQHPPSHVLPDSCDFTVFGGTGDLALRKLLPSLYHRDLEGQLPADYRILGVSRSDLDDAGWRAEVRAALHTHVDAADLYDGAVDRFLARLYHLMLDAEVPEDWDRFHSLLKDRPRPDRAVRVFYLAVSPQLFRPDLPAPRRDRRRRRARPRRPREADRPRPRLGPGRQRGRRPGLRGVADLPDRPLPRQGERPEPPRHPLRQHLPRAALELTLGRPRRDHRLRDRRCRRPRRVLRQRRRAARHGAEPPASAALPGRDGAADIRRSRDGA